MRIATFASVLSGELKLYGDFHSAGGLIGFFDSIGKPMARLCYKTLGTADAMPLRKSVDLAPHDGIAGAGVRRTEGRRTGLGDGDGRVRGRYGGYRRRRWIGGVLRRLPVTETPAEQCGGAALSAEDDDMVLQGKVRVPRHKSNVVGRGNRQYPVVTGLLLDSASAGE